MVVAGKLCSIRLAKRLRCASLVAIAAIGFSCVPPVTATHRAPTELGKFTSTTAAARLDKILRLVRNSNAPILIGQRKWRTLVAEHREAIESSRSHAQFAAATNRLIHDAGISHFGYYYDEQWKYWHMRGVFGGSENKITHVGIIPQRIEGRWHVRGILEGSPCDELDIRVGDELISVDGFPYEPVVAFKGTQDRPITLRLKRKPGLIYNVEVTPVKESLHRAMQRGMRKSVTVLRHDGLKMAYLHGWSTLGGGEEYNDVLRLQDDVDGLLLDYRDGFGGTWQRPLAFLLGNDRDASDRRINPEWAKPVVILIGDGTRSAKEIVVDAVKRYRRAPLVGEPSVGHVISVGGIKRVGDNGLLMLPGHRFELEGKPTLPDYPAKRKIAYSAGTDPQLRMAKQILTERIRQHRSSHSRQRTPDKPALYLQP